MFSTGQLIFAVLFVIAFTLLMIISYRKDKILHQKFYKGSWLILVGFIIFISILFLIKYNLKN